MYYASHVAAAQQLLSAYSGEMPLHLYLKSYFSRHKKHGSRDRKLITALCYNYFRLGHALKDITVEERILFAFFICQYAPSAFLQQVKPEWNTIIEKPLLEKLAITNRQAEVDIIFPFSHELSEGIDDKKFATSFLYQPKLFMRIRPHYREIVLSKLRAGNLQFDMISEDCLSLPNSSKIEASIDLDREAVVQDYHSQRTGELLKWIRENGRAVTRVWDCCAASGGKSIMAYDILHGIQLTASDKRGSILQNLQRRFQKAGIQNYTSFVADLSGKQVASGALSATAFDLIIADVPCTGSGTWARTPEQLYYFDPREIERYSNLQKQIVGNAIHHLTPDGYLLYITCSVFKKENEEVAAYIQQKLKMELVRIEVLKGYEMQADSMFAVLFKRSK